MKEISNKESEQREGSEHGDVALERAYRSMREKLDSMSTLFSLTLEEMEDAIQEGYLRLSPNRISSETEAKGKLWITVKNLVIDSFRKRRPIDVYSSIEEGKNNEEMSTFGIDYLAIRKQMKEILSHQQWKIMHLLVEQEMDYPEIAQELGMAEGTVRTHVEDSKSKCKTLR